MKICVFPDPILRQPAERVTDFDQHLEVFVHSLIKTLRDQPGGIGIAASQVGVLKKIAIVDVRPKDKSKELMILINPQIVEYGEPVIMREGCMSLPDFTGNVKRSADVTVVWQDLKGNKQKRTTSGIEAICVQHEVDHLNGLLFIDRVNSLKRDVFRRKRYLK